MRNTEIVRFIIYNYIFNYAYRTFKFIQLIEKVVTIFIKNRPVIFSHQAFYFFYISEMKTIISCKCGNIAVCGAERDQQKANNSKSKGCTLKINEQDIYIRDPSSATVSPRSTTRFCIACNKCCESFLVSIHRCKKIFCRKAIDAFQEIKQFPTLDKRMPIEIRPLIQIGEPNREFEQKVEEKETDVIDPFLNSYESVPSSFRDLPPFSCSASSFLMSFSMD